MPSQISVGSLSFVLIFPASSESEKVFHTSFSPLPFNLQKLYGPDRFRTGPETELYSFFPTRFTRLEGLPLPLRFIADVVPPLGGKLSAVCQRPCSETTDRSPRSSPIVSTVLVGFHRKSTLAPPVAGICIFSIVAPLISESQEYFFSPSRLLPSAFD